MEGASAVGHHIRHHHHHNESAMAATERAAVAEELAKTSAKVNGYARCELVVCVFYEMLFFLPITNRRFGNIRRRSTIFAVGCSRDHARSVLVSRNPRRRLKWISA